MSHDRQKPGSVDSIGGKEKGMFTVIKGTCRKAVAVALCSILSFGVVSTAMMEPASAASRHSVSYGDRDKGLERMNSHQRRDREFRERQRREEERRERERRERERRERERHERERHEREHRSNRGHSQGEVNTAAIVGAIIGAVIATNT